MTTVFDPRAKEGALSVRSDLGTLSITGSDRKKWLNGLVTCDLAKLAPNEAAYGLAVSKVGRILADVIVLETGDRLLVAVPRERASTLMTEFDRYLVMEDAEIADASDRWTWTLLHGPASAAIARSLASHSETFAGAVDLTGIGGAVVVSAASIDDALRDSGATIGDDASWELLRVERAVPRWGVDFDEKTYPQEASLEKRAVSFQKGCYLGQEVVCRLEMRGHVHRKLVAIELEGASGVAKGADVTTSEGSSVGAVTSSVASPHSGHGIALAVVKYASSDVGASLVIAGRPGRVVELPVS